MKPKTRMMVGTVLLSIGAVLVVQATVTLYRTAKRALRYQETLQPYLKTMDGGITVSPREDLERKPALTLPRETVDELRWIGSTGPVNLNATLGCVAAGVFLVAAGSSLQGGAKAGSE